MMEKPKISPLLKTFPIQLKRRPFKRLPIPIAFLVGLVGLIGGILLVNNLRDLRSQASTEITPRQIKIANIGSSSFTVSWITQEKATGSIRFGETGNLDERRNDLRDQNRGEQDKYLTHFVLVENLKPETKYYFKIISSGTSYDNSGKLFEVPTGPFKIPSDNDIAQGKILTPTKEPALGALVYLSMANTIIQAAITDSEGNWMIPLSTARSLDLKDFSNYDRNAQVEEIFVIQEENKTATATVATTNDNPVPDIILGQSYDFLTSAPEVPNTPIPIRENFSGSLGPASTQSGSFQQLTEGSDLTISFPSENEKVNNTQPEFLGSGPKGQKLMIKIESEQEIVSEAQASLNGKWGWSPPVPLSPGQHQITVSYTDQNGFVKKVTRIFTVLAEGSSDLPSFTATPSGQTVTPSPRITPSPTSGPSPTNPPTTSGTPSPTSILSPTPTETVSATTISPTSVPTIPYRRSVPSTESGVPRPGTTTPTKFLFGAGFVTILIGAALVLF